MGLTTLNLIEIQRLHETIHIKSSASTWLLAIAQ